MKRLIYLIRELESMSHPLALECDRIMIWEDLFQEKKQWIRLWLDKYKSYNIVLPQPLMVEIALALLDSYEERKEKLGVITNLESRRQNNESKATD